MATRLRFLGFLLLIELTVLDVSGRAAPVFAIEPVREFRDSLLSLNDQQILGLRWTSFDTFSSVQISALLSCFSCDPGGPAAVNGQAYLVRSIGPGATTADLIASNTNIEVGYHRGLQWIPLFSGLTLDQGDYFLILFQRAGSGEWLTWRAGDAATPVTIGPGITWDQLLYVANAPLGPHGELNIQYPPGSTFGTVPIPMPTGTPNIHVGLRVVSEVPEPASISLAFVGLVAGLARLMRLSPRSLRS